MRALWPIERAVLDAVGCDNPSLAEPLRQQADAAQVIEHENTGVGFFSTVTVEGEVPPLLDGSPLDDAFGTIGGLEHGMGFVVFFEKGRLSLIEGYSFGDAETADIDFGEVEFDVKPWSVSTGAANGT
jgi:hypothetical protein